MSLMDQFNDLINVILVAIVLVILIVCAALFYFLKIRKVKSSRQTIDYTSLEIDNTLEYVKFEDVVSDKGEFALEDMYKDAGMMVVGQHTFISGITVYGFDFYDAAYEEQQSTIAHMIGFTHLIEKPIQIRQTAKAIDMSEQREVFLGTTERLQEELYNLQEDFKLLKERAEDYVDDPEEFEVTIQKMEELKRKITGTEFELGVSRGLNGYIDKVSGSENTQRAYTIMFTFEYNPDAYSAEMNENEIRLTALKELEIKARAYISALNNTGARCERMTPGELLEEVHRHYHPITANEMPLKERLEHRMDAFYIDSNTLVEKEIARISEESYNRQMEDYRLFMEEKERKDELRLQRIYRKELERASELAKEEIENALYGAEGGDE